MFKDIAGVAHQRQFEPYGYLAALGAVGLATLAAVAFDAQVHAPNLSLVFVLPVVFAAAIFGWGPALTAALGGVLAYNYFLITPRHTFHVADPGDAWALLLLMVTAALVSGVAARGRRRALAAEEAAAQGQALHGLARAMVGEIEAPALAQRCAETLSELFSAPVLVLLEDDGILKLHGQAGGAAPSASDLEAAEWCVASQLAVRGGAYPAGEATFDFWPLKTTQRRRAAIGVRISQRDEGRPNAPERLVEIVSGYLSVALDREILARQVLDQRVQLTGDRLKADLLAAVSHDLKTPLSTVLLTLQSLQRFDADHDSETRVQLLASAEAETARLSRMVDNLLDMGRVEAGALSVHTKTIDLTKLAEMGLDRASHILADHRMSTGAMPSVSVEVDPALFESSLTNVLENAAKYAPKGTEIEMGGGTDGVMAWLEVRDQGPGFGGPVEPMFAKFARGREGDGRPPGTGLGLAIARSFLEAQGGRIEAGDRLDRSGAWVRLLAPLAKLV